MKKQVYIIAIVIVLAGAFSRAQAQTASAQQFTAEIPFAFHVGNQTLPAGEYTVRCTNPSSDMKVLQLRSKDGKTSALLQTRSVIGRSKAGARLVFNRYGNQYYLAQAWSAAETVGLQASKSRSERATAKELSRLSVPMEMVALIVRQ